MPNLAPNPGKRVLDAAQQQGREPDRDAITYQLPDAARVIGVSVRTLYNLEKAGELAFVKIGKRTLVRRSDLVALIDAKAGAA